MHTGMIWNNCGSETLKNRLWMKAEFCELELLWVVEEKQTKQWVCLAVKIDLNIEEMSLLRIQSSTM